ncbi:MULTISPECIES: hypothetical protein [Rhizobium/Agrobacterium group]|uniref:hypothetical protein n=1 Tax=Rhizobium/Agrobacterium group TaxID=227290 RepID=UPI0016504B66|nr:MULTISPECIES: hypothetical protein [Rhizobium/Agrobacterium group]
MPLFARSAFKATEHSAMAVLAPGLSLLSRAMMEVAPVYSWHSTRTLRQAVVVVDVLNFHHAANVLGTPQSSVSARRKGLDDTCSPLYLIQDSCFHHRAGNVPGKICVGRPCGNRW